VPVGARDHGFHPLQVSRVIPETADAVSIALDIAPELRSLFSYAAGQFVTFRVTIEGQEYLRSYSMSSSPEVDPEFRVTVKRVPGGIVSGWLTQSLAAGDAIESTRPAGVFTLGESRGELVAFAGGSGITPVFSLLKSALTTTSRRVRLLYANRDHDGAIFREQLASLSERYGERLEIVHHYDSDQGFLVADGISPYARLASDSDYYVCGPAPFMNLVESTLHAHHVDAERIHIERFAPTTPPQAEVLSTQHAPSAARVTITLKGTTKTAAHRAGTTILQTARSMGLTPPFSCEAGDCATCMARVIEGAADMFANHALLDGEVAEGWILTCQAVPTTASVTVIYED
jgi:3-ketosteroid 9alpha-monooxygenase subunit B